MVRVSLSEFFGVGPPRPPPPSGPPAQYFCGGAWGAPKKLTWGVLGGPPAQNMGGAWGGLHHETWGHFFS